jgi:hypothetical protein
MEFYDDEGIAVAEMHGNAFTTSKRPKHIDD